MNRRNEIRLNTFSGTSSGEVTGRYGFSQDTDTDISRKFDLEILRAEDDEKEDHYRNVDARIPEINRLLVGDRPYDGYNVPVGAVNFDVNIPVVHHEANKKTNI